MNKSFNSFKAYYGTPISGVLYNLYLIEDYIKLYPQFNISKTNLNTIRHILNFNKSLLLKSKSKYLPHLPITQVFETYMCNKSVLIPFLSNTDLDRSLKLCKSFIVDNSAYTFWKKKGNATDKFWKSYYKWIEAIYHEPKLDWFIIPDVIMGSEIENDKLISDFTSNYPHVLNKAVPVWHINESLDRLRTLSYQFPRVCIGSAEEKIYGKVGSDKWFNYLIKALNVVNPKTKIHLLRFLAKKSVDKLMQLNLDFEFSGDSTNFAQNHHRKTKLGLSPHNLILKSNALYKII